jgi:hypothetical protein
LIALLFGNLALAQKKPLACQVDAAAGLKWENGQWKITRFIERKFILVLQGNTLTKDDPPAKTITCADRTSETLIFNLEISKAV